MLSRADIVRDAEKWCSANDAIPFRWGVNRKGVWISMANSTEISTSMLDAASFRDLVDIMKNRILSERKKGKCKIKSKRLSKK